ncbi:MAG: PKD domain-containing protein, partial [bacterium]
MRKILLTGLLITGCFKIGYCIEAQITASRTAGVAPLAVFFDVVGEMSNPHVTWNEIETHEFIWDFGAGSEADLSSGGRYADGYMAAHVFETPGTYTVSLTVKQSGSIVGT